MSTNTHTPGPWRLMTTSMQSMNYQFHTIMGPSDKMICHITDGTPENMANAQLISQAPELLQICKNLYLNSAMPEDLSKELKLVIVKAEGGKDEIKN